MKYTMCLPQISLIFADNRLVVSVNQRDQREKDAGI
jgi:hypothetical protein